MPGAPFSIQGPGAQISKVGAQFMQPGAGPGRGRNIEIRGAALATGGPQGLDFLTKYVSQGGGTCQVANAA